MNKSNTPGEVRSMELLGVAFPERVNMTTLLFRWPRNRLGRSWLDRKIDVPPRAGLPVAMMAVAVFFQWAMILFQIFCPPCMRTMFEFLSL